MFQIYNFPLKTLIVYNTALIGVSRDLVRVDGDMWGEGLGRNFLRIQVDFKTNEPLILGFKFSRRGMKGYRLVQVWEASEFLF